MYSLKNREKEGIELTKNWNILLSYFSLNFFYSNINLFLQSSKLLILQLENIE